MDAGATATDNVDGDITANIVIDDSTVDTSTLGTYRVTFNVSDAANNAATEQIRNVTVVAPADTTPPVITLTDGDVQITQGENYVDAGATATDNVDGDITANIVIDDSAVDTSTLGTYRVTFNVSDAANNAATEQVRNVTVVAPADTTPPVITLVDGDVQITQGENYVDAGATATDNVDGDITANIVIDDSAVDTRVWEPTG